MRRHMFKAVLLLMALALVGGPVAADDITGHEEDTRTLDCPGPEGVPNNQEPPGPGECDEPEETTYEGKYWDNDVQCNSGGTATPVGDLYFDGDEGDLWGVVGLCNDGDGALPVQGRVHARGSEEDGGFTVTADGDKDNDPEQAQGWAQVYAGTDGPSLTCGDANGKQDSSHQGPEDGQDDCG